MFLHGPIRIYLEDTDAGGIVYHASYLRLMERARTELLRRAGFEQSKTFEQDVSFVLHSMKLRFHAPAKLDDQVWVSCALVGSSAASFTLGQEVVDADNRQLRCSAEAVVACVNLANGRPRRLPATLLEFLQREAAR